jgi:methionine sulfoxide reductase catalytic subunit
MTDRHDRDNNEDPTLSLGFRSQLTKGKDRIDPGSWAGSIPEARGIVPHVRIGRDRWISLLWLLPIGFLALIITVATAQGLRNTACGQRFMAQYPGTLGSTNAAGGLPVWVAAQHFLNLFLMIFIVRAELQILSDHPRLYWTRHDTPGRDWFRFRKQVPGDPLWTAKQDSVSLPRHIGSPGIRHSIGLARMVASGH